MKPSKFLACAAVGFLLAACSADEPEINPGNSNTFEGDGYLAVSINLPTIQGTRAINDVFDDGSDNEYFVKDAVLVLFKGTSEETAECQAAYDLGSISAEKEEPSNDNITSRFAKAVKVENVSLGENEHLYAFVMLNYTDVASVFDNNLVLKNADFDKGAAFKGTFKELLAVKSNQPLYRTSDDGSASYFLMCNSPIAASIGGTTKPATTTVTTLVTLNGELQPTEKEALDNINGDIYVERAVAKATLSAPEVAKIEGETLKISKVEWIIVNDEPESFLVRNVMNEKLPTTIGGHDLSYIQWTSKEKTNYRFVGASQIDNVGYRHYWCIDPSYNVDKTYTDVPAIEGTNPFFAKTKTLYCHENTFDVEHQNYKNTTRAVLKVTYECGDFWTLNGDNKKAFHKVEDAETHAKDYIVRDATLQDAIKKALKADVSNYNIAGCVELTWADNKETGVHEIVGLKINSTDTNFATTPDFDPTTLIANANELYSIVKYAGGVSYYDFRFMHFGGTSDDQDLAPWKTDKATTPDVYASYGNGAKNGMNENSEINYLGRWGMVRNNWYNVEITAFNSLGSPVIPEANVDTPDDNVDKEQWLSFRINILSWAVRTQSFIL